MSSDTCCHRSECATNAKRTGRIFSLGPLASRENVKSSAPERAKQAWRKSCIAFSLRSERVSSSEGQNLTVRCISTHNLGRDSATLRQKLQILPSSQGMESSSALVPFGRGQIMLHPSAANKNISPRISAGSRRIGESTDRRSMSCSHMSVRYPSREAREALRR